jgi:uncharacterized protein (TIGR02145 family)
MVMKDSLKTILERAFYSDEYANINGILLKRENETLDSCELFTHKEAVELVKNRRLRLPSRYNLIKILKSGYTWDDKLRGIWIGENHRCKKETRFSTFLPAAGCLSNSEGRLYFCGNSGYYWSGTEFNPVYSNTIWSINFVREGCSMGNSDRDFGFSVRCIKR